MALQHTADDNISHEMTLSAADYSNIPAMDMHEHVETCAMKTCSVTTENFHEVEFALVSENLEFPSLIAQLDGVSHNPPLEPPKV